MPSGSLITDNQRHLASYPITIPDTISSLGDFKWNVGVRQYPAFAEYTEPMVADGSSGISDTGLTMRAFLPIDGQGNRSSIHVYKGPATVIDARVVCVRPNITNLGSRLAGVHEYRVFRPPILHGNMSIPLDLLERAAVSRVLPLMWQTFNCSISTGIAPDQGIFKYHPSDWDLSICQFDLGAGYLRDAWMKPSHPPPRKASSKYFPFKSYLLVNFSSPAKFDYTIYPEVDYLVIQQTFDDSVPGLIRRDRGDWTDVYRTNNNLTAADAMLSFSLCFPASQARYLNISASSTAPLLQPRYRYDPVSQRIRFDDVRKQMMSFPHTTMEQRGILSLEPQPWEKNQGFLPPYLSTRDTDYSVSIDPFEGASTINLLQRYDPVTARADISIGGLLLEVLREGGTTAEAVQSMMTALLASRYQDYVFLKGGNTTFASRSDFIAVQIPGGKGQPADHAAGATLAYTLVMAAIAVHLLTVSFVVVWFCKGMCT